MSSARPRGDDEWNWLRLPSRIGHFLVFEPRGGGTLELVCPPAWPLAVDTNRDDNSWATKDLFVKHETLKDAYQYVGRLDDVVVLENGEKVNPIAVEGEIANSAFVDSCVIFGSGRSALGAAVVPSGAAASMSEDELRSTVWTVIQSAQVVFPAYARISEDMVLILPLGSAVPKTDKSTVIRGKFLASYKDEIDKLYDEQAGDPTMTEFSKEELLDFLEAQLIAALRLPAETRIERERDFGTLGLDSLQALRLRSAVIKNVNLKGGNLGLNVVLEYPTLDTLATEIMRVCSGGEAINTDIVDEEGALSMIRKYSSFSRPGESLNPGTCIVSSQPTPSFIILDGVQQLTPARLSLELLAHWAPISWQSLAFYPMLIRSSVSSERPRTPQPTNGLRSLCERDS